MPPFFIRFLTKPAVLIRTPRSLKKAAPEHQFLLDLEEKSALFDKAATKFTAKVAG